MSVRESEIEAHLVKRVKERGGEVRKVQWVGRLGAPDRLVMLPPKWLPVGPEFGIYERTDFSKDDPAFYDEMAHRPSAIWVELKAPGQRPRPSQVREHERMRAMGQRVVVIDSIEGVEGLLA